MLELRNVSFYYEEKHKILDHVSLSFSSHGLVMIEGESGSGKSTLLSLLHCEKEVKEGDILFFHQSLKEMNEQEKMDYRLFSCGVVYQDYGLFSHLSIEENLKMFMSVVNKNEDIPTLLKKVGLSIDPKTNVDVLSGGEKQRVAIARSMILTSPILLLDEPTSSLDDKNAFEIMDLLKELSKKSLIMIVTHDHRMIEQYSDEHYHMENGTLTLIKKEEVEPVSYSFLHPKRKRFHYGIYLKRRLVHKKKRAVLLVSFLSMSVFIGSFSAILMNNMKEEMTSSFSHFASGKEIQMTVKNENTQDDRYSLDKEEFVTIQKENQNMDMMFYYEEDLSYAFPSRNEFRIFSLPGYPLLKVDFTEKVDVSMFAYAKKDFIMNSDEFDDDYKGMTFEIEKYDIIGVNDGFNIYFRHDYSKDNLSRSIFSIVPNENMESGAYSVDYNTGNKIVISLSKEDYQNFELINRAQIYKEIAFNMILIPALIEGLSLCKKGMDYASKDLDDIENDYVWFRSIRKAFSRLKGREITSQDLDKPIDMAQELLGKPFSVALEKIMEEMNKNMGDEENE